MKPRPAVDVLIVDDDEGTRASLDALLGDGGYRVATAANGCDALRHLRLHHPPKVILLDLMMPVMDGWEFRSILRAEPRLAEVPIIAMTGVRTDRPTEARLGATWYVRKPFDPDRVLRLVAAICRAA